MAGLRRGMWIIRNMFNQAELDSYPVARELTGIYLTLRDPNVGGAVRRFDLPPHSSAYDYLTDAPQSNVGGGLPPMAVDHLVHAVTDTPQSGASPLPQGSGDDLADEE